MACAGTRMKSMDARLLGKSCEHLALIDRHDRIDVAMDNQERRIVLRNDAMGLARFQTSAFSLIGPPTSHHRLIRPDVPETDVKSDGPKNRTPPGPDSKHYMVAHVPVSGFDFAGRTHERREVSARRRTADAEMSGLMLYFFALARQKRMTPPCNRESGPETPHVD